MNDDPNGWPNWITHSTAGFFGLDRTLPAERLNGEPIPQDDSAHDCEVMLSLNEVRALVEASEQSPVAVKHNDALLAVLERLRAYLPEGER